MRFTRTPGPVDVDALSGDPSAALASPDVLVGDLTLGAWRGHELARQLRAQLGVPAVEPASGAVEPEDIPPPYATLVAAGIDAEASGDVVTLAALAHTEAVLEALHEGPPRTVVVLAPLPRVAWGRENEVFLHLLAQAIRDEAVEVLVGRASGEARGGSDLLALVPGLVDDEVLAAVGASAEAARPLAGGLRLVSPERRRRPADVRPFEYDRLAVAAAAAGIGWLSAYAELRGSGRFAEPSRLRRHAGERFAEGSHDIALELLERAVESARGALQRSTCEAALQGMRLNLQRFSDAAAAPDPAPRLPAPLLGFLWQAKGWGLVLTSDAARAEPYLERARAVLDDAAGTVDYAFLLNILALCRLRNRDLAGALALEREIERDRARHRSFQLDYVNSINIARLLRRLGLPQEAARYYDRAFDTTLGLRSESDRVYVNLCRAQVAEQRGDADAVFASWLRCALHWVSSTAPEALAPRVVGALLGGGFRAAPPEEISAALHDSLSEAAGGQSPPAGEPPVFVTPAAARAGGIAAGGDGWGVVAQVARARPAWDGPEHRRLRALLAAILGELDGSGTLAEAGTVVVDSGLGEELPATELELLDTSVRLGCVSMIFEGRRYELTEELRLALEAASVVELGSGVASVERSGGDAIVHFKRYLPPRRLTPGEAAVVEACGSSLGRRGDPALVRALEADRVVRLRPPKSASLAALPQDLATVCCKVL